MCSTSSTLYWTHTLADNCVGLSHDLHVRYITDWTRWIKTYLRYYIKPFLIPWLKCLCFFRSVLVALSPLSIHLQPIYNDGYHFFRWHLNVESLFHPAPVPATNTSLTPLIWTNKHSNCVKEFLFLICCQVQDIWETYITWCTQQYV